LISDGLSEARLRGLYRVIRGRVNAAPLRGLCCLVENHVTGNKRGLALHWSRDCFILRVGFQNKSAMNPVASWVVVGGLVSAEQFSSAVVEMEPSKKRKTSHMWEYYEMTDHNHNLKQ